MSSSHEESAKRRRLKSVVGEETSEETPACQPCRKKKSRCSRQQPCSQCVKSGVECTYEDRRLKGGIKTGAVERLSHRIDALENMFLGQGLLLQQVIQEVGSRSTGSASSPAPKSADGEISSSTLQDQAERVRQTLTSLAASAAYNWTESQAARDRIIARVPVIKNKRGFDSFVPAKVRVTTTTTTLSAASRTVASDLCSLHPLPTVIDAVMSVYFKVVHPWMPVLHPATLVRCVRDPDRPPGVTMVLKAIVAVAAKYLPADHAKDVDLSDYAETCRRKVVAAATEMTSIDALQSLLVIALDTLNTGSSASPWSLVALITRKIEDLRLYTEDAIPSDGLLSDCFATRTSPSRQPHATASWLETEEQRRVFWLSFLMDRFCSIATGSTPTIASKAIRQRLPCDGCMFESDQAVETSYFTADDPPSGSDTAAAVDVVATAAAAAAATIAATAADASPLLLSGNREGFNNIGGLAYTIEATEALALVARFNLRHPLRAETAAADEQLSTWLIRFRQLDSQLLQWDLSLTQKWREVRVVHGYVDPNLALAHLTHNAAVILLHRTLAYPLPQIRLWLSGLIAAASRESCVNAALKIDRITRRYLAASDGIAPAQFALCLFTAGQRSWHRSPSALPRALPPTSPTTSSPSSPRWTRSPAASPAEGRPRPVPTLTFPPPASPAPSPTSANRPHQQERQ